MGFGDFLDSVGDALEGAAHGAEHLAGTALDVGAHAIGDGLNALGLHGAATTVDNAGDSIADHLGDQVPEKQLGQTTDPTQLIHGDQNAIGQNVSDLGNFSRAFGDTAQGLAGIDTSHWQGQAAETFRSSYEQHPQEWAAARDACQTAADTLQHYGTTVAWAQQQAQQAIDLFQKGTQASATAVARYAQAVDSYNDAANAYSYAVAFEGAQSPAPRAPAPFVDPGKADCQRAQDLLTAARRQRDTAGAQAQQAITQATASAPATPRFTQRMLDDAQDTAMTAGVEGEHVIGGVTKGVGDMVKFVRGINPLDPYNVTHPADYVDHLSQTAAGLVHVALHPQQLVTGLVGTGWGSDPAEAFGRLIPNLVATVGTDGAAEAGEAGMDAAEAAGAAGKAGEGAAEDAASAGRAGVDTDPGLATDGTNVAHPNVDPSPAPPSDPGADDGWGDFGPSGNPDLHSADSAAAGNLDTAGGGLGQAERDLGGVHVHAETTTSAASQGVGPMAGHVPAPRLPENPAPASAGVGDVSGIQSRLGGIEDPQPVSITDPDASATQRIAGAGDDLGTVEHDLSEIHAHEPEGAGYNNPDYSDPRYQAGPRIQDAYDQKYPPNSGTRRFVDDTRAENPQVTKPLSDQEILALKQLTRMDHMDINQALRLGDQPQLQALDAEIRNMVSGLNKLPDYTGGPVFRGIDIPPSELDSVLDRYTPGQTVSEPAFTHTDKSVPFSGNVQFVITGGPGKDIGFVRDQTIGQQEVIYPPGTKFEVTERKYNPETQEWTIFLDGE